jgi:hypothetical protein
VEFTEVFDMRPPQIVAKHPRRLVSVVGIYLLVSSNVHPRFIQEKRKGEGSYEEQKI